MRTDQDTVEASSRPGLAPHVRLRFDRARDQHVLLAPESVVLLNRTGADILGLCDGQRTVAQVAARLRERYDQVAEVDIQRFLARLVARRCVELRDG
jgi:pyrroloquinoline quinone biosynthesis protein D